jgi:hypothetical protein
MNADALLLVVGCLGILALIIALALKRLIHAIPVFFWFLIFELFLTFALQSVSTYASQRNYILFWCAAAYVDVLFNFAVIVEVGKNLLRFDKNRSAQLALAVGLFLLVSLVLIRLIQWDLSPRPSIWRLSTHTVQITALLQLAAFLSLVAWSNLKKLRWPRREFRIGSGMGFFALVAFAVAITYSYVHGPAYRWLSYLPSFAAIGVYFYWLEYFLFEDPTPLSSRNRMEELVESGLPDRDRHSAQQNLTGANSSFLWVTKVMRRRGEA